MGSLYELTDAARRLNELLEEGVLSEEDIRDAIINNNEEIGLKLEGCAKYIRNLEADVAGLKEEEKRLHERRSTMENAIASMKKAMEEALRVSVEPDNKGKITKKTALFSFSIAKNAPSVVLEECYLENIPDRYLIPQEPKVDRKLMLEDLKGDDEDLKFHLEGIAHLEQTESIRIR